MPQPESLDPSAYAVSGGSVGALLIHGFTGSVAETRPMGEYLAHRGLTVECPLLPGHGTHPQDLTRIRWQDWAGATESALKSLQNRCEVVFVGGLSMGSLLTLYLAANHSELSGIIIYSPAVKVADRLLYLAPVLKYAIPKKRKSDDSDLTDPEAELRLWHYDENPAFAAHELLKLIRLVRRLLPQVTCPTLTIYSILDQAIHPDSAPYTYQHVGSRDKELVTLHASGHVVTVDAEWEAVAEATYQFIRSHLPEQARAGA